MFIITMTLLCFGMIMIYSASFFTATSDFSSSYFFLKKHVRAIILGSIAMFLFSRIQYWKLKKITFPLMALSIILLIAVLFTERVLGARRGLKLIFISFMPSELAKLSLIIFYAYFLSTYNKYRNNFTKGFLPCVGVLFVFDILIMKQPDFSTTVIVTLLSFFMMYIGCINIKHLGLTFVTGAVGAVFVVQSASYRLARYIAWLDPFADRWGKGYHIVQSLIAVGSGGITGSGLGQSWGKMGYLPYQYNDYIFAVIGEELGFIGCVVLIILYFAFLWRGFLITRGAPDMFGILLGAGICFNIAFQAFINMAVVLNLLPATGLPLPFISYSGSSLVITMASIGILLNISKYSKKNSEF